MKLMSDLRVDEISKFRYLPTKEALQDRNVDNTICHYYVIHSINEDGIILQDSTQQLSLFRWKPNELMAIDVYSLEKMYEYEILQTCQTLHSTVKGTHDGMSIEHIRTLLDWLKLRLSIWVYGKPICDPNAKLGRYLKIDEIDLTIKRLIELVVAETELYLEEMEKFVKKGCK